MKLKESLRNLRNKISKKTAIVAMALVIGVAGGAVAGVRYTSAFSGDCDTNAVMYCGGETVGALKTKYDKSADVRNIYAAVPFKLSSQKMASSWSSMQRGEVHRNGDVKLNGKVVAKGAVTAGRNHGNTAAIRNASVKMPGVNAYYRAAGVNMGENTTALVAFVKLDANGRFEFAIIRSCGNPVIATPVQPPANPGISVTKSVKKAGTKDEFAQEISVSPGQKVEYVVGIKNTGNVQLTNVKVRDVLPSNVRYVADTTDVVRSYGGTTHIANIISGSQNIGTIPVYGTAFVFFQATAPTVNDPIQVCGSGNTRLQNVAYAKPDQTSEKYDNAYINTCKPKPPTPKKPDFKIVKSVKKAGTKDEFKQDITVKPGEKVQYVVGVQNTGEVPLTNMWIRDELPTNVRYVANTTKLTTSYSADKQIANIVGEGVSIGTMPVGGSAFIFFEATAPNETDSNVKECKDGLTNLRNVAFAHPDQLGRKEDDAYIKTCKTTPPSKPDFKIVKSVKKAGTKDEFAQNVEAAPGTKLTYVIGVQNTGDTTLKNILVKDVLPGGMKYVPGSAKITTSEGVSDKKITDNLVTSGYTIASLGVKQTAFIFFDATLPEASNPIVKECQVGKTKLTNKATAKPENLPVKEDDATAETCKPKVVKNPGVSIDKKVDGVEKKQVAVGQVFTYQVVVKNTGDVDLKDVKVKDDAPKGVKLLSASAGVIGQAVPSGTQGNVNLYFWIDTIPSLKVGESKTYTIRAVAENYVAGELVNTACVNAKEVNPGEPTKQDDCDTATVTVTPPVVKNPGISIEKKVNGKERDEVAVGETFTYTLVVKNTGEVNLKNAVVSDNAPANVQLISTDKGSVAGNKLAYTIPSLNVGQSVTITIKAKATAYKAGDIVNTACVNTPEVNPGEPTKQDDCDTATVTTEEPAKPVYECTSLGALSLGDLKYRFTPQINMSGSVSVTKVSYNFGDNTSPVVQNNANSVEHTYAAVDVDKTYTTTATVSFNVGGVAKSVDCAAQVKITATPDVPCEYNPDLPKDHPDCKPPVVEPPVTPPVTPPSQPTPKSPVNIIPSTGIGGAMSGLVGTFAATYGGYALLEARRKRA